MQSQSTQNKLILKREKKQSTKQEPAILPSPRGGGTVQLRQLDVGRTEVCLNSEQSDNNH